MPYWCAKFLISLLKVYLDPFVSVKPNYLEDLIDLLEAWRVIGCSSCSPSGLSPPKASNRTLPRWADDIA